MIFEFIVEKRIHVYLAVLIITIINVIAPYTSAISETQRHSTSANMTADDIETWHINLKLASLDGKARDTYNRAGVVITQGIDPQQISALDLTPPGKYIRLVLKDPLNPGREGYSYDYRAPDLDEYMWEVDHYWDEPLILRIEFGWGPWASLEMARVCDWEIETSLKGGRILEYQPCFQSGPLEEKRRNIVTQTGENTLRIQSYTSRTSRRQALAEKPTNAVVLKVQVEPESLLEIRTSKPSKKFIRKKLSELAGANDIVFTGPFPDESILIHQLVPQAQAGSSFTVC